MTTSKQSNTWLRLLEWWLVFLLPLVPLALLTYNAWIFNLGADPAQEIVLETGVWAINLLWITLAITPLRRIFKIHWPMRYRRMLGLYSLFYAVVHLLSFATFILGWQWALLLKELVERPYIVVGALALLMLVPLGITSTQKMQRRLGKNWLNCAWLTGKSSVPGGSVGSSPPPSQVPVRSHTPHSPVVPGVSPCVHHLARHAAPAWVTWLPPT